MNTVASVKAALAAQYPAEDYKLTVKEVAGHEVKTRILPYTQWVETFVAVGVEARRANGENWKGQARKVHPGDEEVIGVLRKAGFKAQLHKHSMTAQMIGICE